MGYCVYKHTVPNGKVYIGVTGRDPDKRFACGHGYEKNVLFWRAIKKYGWKNIKHEILYDNLEKDVAFELEQKLIKEYDSCNTGKGYNISVGGKGGTLGAKLSDDTRRKMSESRSGRHPSEETREKLRLSKLGNKNPNYGKKLSEEQKKKMGESIRKAYETSDLKDIISAHSKKYWSDHPEFRKIKSEETSKRNSCPVVCVETGIVYNSQKEACADVGLCPRIFSKKLRNKEPYGGFHWRKYEEDL